MARIFPSYITAIRSAKVRILVQVCRDEQYSTALVALLHQVLVNKRCRTNIEATRRLCGNEEGQRSRALTRDDHLLLVPAREITPACTARVRSAYVKGLHEAGRVGGNGGGIPDHPVGKRLLIIRVQHEIIGNGIALDHPMFMAIFRNVRHAACC